MKILAIDTATEACSVALYNSSLNSPESEKDNETLCFDLSQCDGKFEVCPQKHSQQILPMIDNMLREHDLSVTDLDALSYAQGPGSFTGVRIAASTIQGLALGANLPVVQVSTLAVMAQEVFSNTQCKRVISSIDARMEEVYIACYELDDESQIMQLVDTERVVSPLTALKYAQKQISYANGNVSFAGTGFITYDGMFDSITNGHPNVRYPNAKFILPLAFEALKKNKCLKVEDVAPVYVRDTVTWKKLPNKV